MPAFMILLAALLALVCALLFLARRRLGLFLARKFAARALERDVLGSLRDGLYAGLGGSGAPLADAHRAGPCVFIYAGKRLVIVDAGDGATRKLALMGIPLGQVDALFLTHFHSDHIASLGELMLQRWAGGTHKDPLPVHGPQGVDAVVAGIHRAYSADDGYRIAHHGPAAMPPSGAGGVAHPFQVSRDSGAAQVILELDGLTVSAFPVDHVPVFPAVGYRFDYGGRSVVVSGDTAPSPVLEQVSAGADVLFHEALQPALVSILESAARKAGRGAVERVLHDIPGYHSSPEDAAAIATRAGVKHLVFYHLIPPLPSRALHGAFLGGAPAIYKGPISIGTDGLMLCLPSASTAIEQRKLL
jgi:ribonuclease Z